MNTQQDVPVFAHGLGRIKLALRSTLHRQKHHRAPATAESTRWRDDLLAAGSPEVRGARTLADLGYTISPHADIPAQRITGVAAVHRLLSAEAVGALRTICTGLETHAGDSDWIISRRTRGVTAVSRFVADMMNSRAFLLAVSRIAGVPLVPYPMINARSQVNYFYPKAQKQARAQVGMWHTDGTNYVLNLLLSDQGDYTGGEFLYHDGTIDTFDKAAAQHASVKTAQLPAAGDALFIYGSRLFHGVRPVTSGRRMSLVLSFHCPYTRDGEDSNRFWHLASDDGIPATLPNWIHLRRALTRSVDRQYAALGIAPITFDELAA